MKTYISNAGDVGAFQLFAIKVLNGCFKIGMRLEFDETKAIRQLL